MGAKPLVALNLVAFPTGSVPMEVLGRILDGGRETDQAAGAQQNNNKNQLQQVSTNYSRSCRLTYAHE